jgi:hypothetical protein
MPWPEPVGRLLGTTDSRAAQALRWGLVGLRASLRAALEENADDPGGVDLRGLLSELDALLGRDQVASSCRTDFQGRPNEAGRTWKSVLPSEITSLAGVPSDPVLPPDGTPPAASPWLLPLARALAADARLGRPPVRDTNDDAIWNDVNRLLLRLPPGLADEWRRRSLQQAEQAGGRADETAMAIVPLGSDEVLYPGLTGAIRADGLRAGAALDPRVAPPADGELRPLAGVASACLWFAEHDPHLGHCLRSVFRFGVTPLAGGQRDRYVTELLRLWAASARPPAGGRQGWKDYLKTWLDFDEAVHSLVYQPPAASDSWWGRLQDRSREMLFRLRDRAVQAGCPVHLQALGGNFAEVSRLAPDSLQVDFGVPGEICVCLRVWARLDGEEIKGRVLYRSPQEDA